MWIKEIVQQLIKKQGTNDPFEIAAAMNIHLIEWEMHDEILGFYKYIRRNKFIYLNSKLDERGKVYTLAHELGHSQLHPRLNTPFLNRKTLYSIDKIENEANRFAVELLLPDKSIYEHSNENMTIKEIGSIYNIPSEVIHLKKI